MSRNDLDMVLLGLSVNELNLLKFVLTQSTLESAIIDIDVKAYARDYGLSVSTAYFTLGNAAKSLFERKLSYYDNQSKAVSTLILGWSGSSDSYRLSLNLSEILFNSLQALDPTELITMLNDFSNPPLSLMRRAYSAKLYLMITDLYEGDAVVISYSALRESLGIRGESYLLTHNFKRRVLNPSIADINKLSLIDVSYTDVTDGRKITDFKFIITPKKAIKSKPQHHAV